MPDHAVVVDKIVERLRPLAIDVNRAWWAANVDATDENEQLRVAAELAQSDLLADRNLYAALESARSGVAAGRARRELDILHDLFLPQQVDADLRRRIIELEASVESRYAQHRGVVRGEPVTDNEIKQTLREGDDVAERREAWEASKTVGAAVAGDVRELARLRNDAARSVGYRDWFAVSIATSEMDEEKLFAMLEEADRVTAEPFGAWKAGLDERLAARFRCAVSELRPWHYADPFFQEVPAEGGVDLDRYFAGRDVVELARRTYDGMGIDTRAILERSDLFPRGRKCQHAFCMDVDHEGDIRVLANVIDNQYWMETMLHELGHGIYNAGFGGELPWLLRDSHLVATEGVAILMGRLGSDAEWLEQVVEVTAREAAALASPLRAARAAELLLFTRWVLVMTNFERSLYGDPDGDLDTRWWELVRRYQLVQPPDRRAPDWASKIHIAVAPVYYHTYLYGQLVASQLASAIEREAGGLVDREAAGRFLNERFFAPGMSVRWDHLIEQATSERLTASHFSRDLQAA